MNIKILPAEWNEATFSVDNPEKFSIVKINSDKGDFARDRKFVCGIFSINISPGAESFLDRLADFIAYENLHGRCVLIFSPDLDIRTALDYQRPPRDFVRKTDPPVMVHSTLLTSYAKIAESGLLKSAARLNRDGLRHDAIGIAQLGEPKDFLEYVMFAVLDGRGSGSETVVNSYLRGKVCFDQHMPYTPQARMYFDTHKIIRDGLAVRDGIHLVKVRDALPLDGYLITTVFEKDVALPDGEAHWTPFLFAKQANKFFLERIK